MTPTPHSLNKEKKVIMIYRESLIQSIVADFVSMVFLIVTFWVNVSYIQSRMLSVILLLLFVLKLIAWMSAKKNVFTDKESAIEFINK